MISAKEALRRYKAISSDELMQEAVEKTKEEGVKTLREQLYKGEGDKDGNKIRYKNKNSRYSKKKNQMNPIPGLGIADLRLTGDLYSNLFIDARETEVYMDSNVPYADVKGDVYGLNEESKKKYRTKLQPVITKRISQSMGLNIKR